MLSCPIIAKCSGSRQRQCPKTIITKCNGNEQPMHCSTFKSLDIAGAPSYIFQSSGPSFHLHGALMGQYCLTGETINRYPVFKKTTYNLTFTLCVNGAGHWVVAYPPQKIGLVNTARPTPRAPPFAGWTDTDDSNNSHTFTLSPQYYWC